MSVQCNGGEACKHQLQEPAFCNVCVHSVFYTILLLPLLSLPTPPLVTSDLLEKSRVIFQQSGERCYHIFYQLLRGAPPELINELLLTNQIQQYKFLAHGTTQVDGVDDAVMYRATRVS